jgi:hypothetical protein
MALNDIRGLDTVSGWLATAGQPTRAQWDDLQAAGFEVVVNLTTPDNHGALPDEDELVRAKGMAYVYLPLVWTQPVRQDVRLHFLERGGQTDISVVFDGPVSDQLAQRWKGGLNALRGTQETGYHLDYLERPMLGVLPGPTITAANAAAHGVPVEYGMVVSGVVPGHAAERAGLQANDVIVRFGGQDMRAQERNLFVLLAQRKAGDVIEVEYVRDGQAHSTKVKLMSRPMFDYPSLAELADQMEQPLKPIVNSRRCLQG